MAYGDPLNSTSDYSIRTWKDLLARMIYSEAGNQSEEGKRGCAFVAQNRADMKSDTFGKNMSEVILKEDQFKGMMTSHALRPDTESEAWKESLDIALNLSSKENPISTCLWFCRHASFAEGYSVRDDKEYFHFRGGKDFEVTEKIIIGDHTFFALKGW